MQKFDVIINGGGFAGLSLAAGLAKLNLKVAIIEPQTIEQIQKNNSDKRTTALSFFSRKYFESIGLWADIEANAGAINDIKIIDSDFVKGDSRLKLDFSYTDVEKEIGRSVPMGHIIENHYFKNLLLKTCLANTNITFFDKRTIAHFEQNASSVAVELKGGDVLSAKILIAADGRNSAIRDMLKIETFDKDYNQVAITFNIKHEKPHNNVAIERFMPTGPIATLPMLDQNKSSIVWTVKAEQAPYYLKMGDGEFNAEVAKRLNGALGEFELETSRSGYPVKLRYAKEFHQGRIALVSDAAHAIHPLAGQGFNQGCKDIALLLKLIEENISVGLGVADSGLLHKYARERIIDNKQMIIATDFFNLLFSNDSKLVTHARRLGISAVDKITPIKKFFIKRAMGA